MRIKRRLVHWPSGHPVLVQRLRTISAENQQPKRHRLWIHRQHTLMKKFRFRQGLQSLKANQLEAAKNGEV